MKIKQKILTICAGIAVAALISGVFVSPSAFAGPAQTTIKCKDGKKVTAHKGDAAPRDTLNNKDYQAACKKHDGYKKPAPAAQPTTTEDSTEPSCSTAILKGFCTKDGIWKILALVVNILATGVGLVAVGGFIYAAILYATAEDNASQVTKAKMMMTNIVIGLVAFALMWGFLQFLIPGGVFSS